MLFGLSPCAMNGTPPSSSFSAVLKNVMCVGYRVIADTSLALSNSTHDAPPCFAATPTPMPHGSAPTTARSTLSKIRESSCPRFYDDAMDHMRLGGFPVERDQPQPAVLPALEHVRVMRARLEPRLAGR